MLMYCEKMDYFTRQSDEYNIQWLQLDYPLGGEDIR